MQSSSFMSVIVLLFLSVLSTMLITPVSANLRFTEWEQQAKAGKPSSPAAAVGGAAADNKAKNFAAGVAPASADAPPPSALTNLKPQQPGFDFNLTNKLPSASSTLQTLSSIPPACSVNIGSGDKAECKATMTATSVTFDDCGDSWTICRCSDAQMDLPTVVERFSRVPVGLRRYVGTVFVMADQSPHAYSLTTGDIHMFNDCQMETWIHESSHAFDYASGLPVSGTKEWTDALENDSCAPDNYALNNRIEDFAQISVLKIYSLAHSGDLPPGFSKECMQRQFDFMDNLPLYNAKTLFGDTCDINIDYKFDLNLGAKKTAAPANPSKKTFPLPDAEDSPVLTAPAAAGAQPSATATSSRMITRPLSSLNADGPNPTGAPKKKVYDNASSVVVAPRFGFLYQGVVVVMMVWWTLF